MYFYKNGRSKLVAEKVLMSNYFLTDNGNVLYLADYSEAYSVGELLIFNGSNRNTPTSYYLFLLKFSITISYLFRARSTDCSQEK